MENGRYQIRCPKSLEELILEGQRMHHCVASYAQRFSNGSSLIFFMRKTEEPDASYITMEFDCARAADSGPKSVQQGNSKQRRVGVYPKVSEGNPCTGVKARRIAVEKKSSKGLLCCPYIPVSVE